MRGIDGNVGNVRRKTVRLFQIMSFILFMALLASMCQPTWNINILSSQNILENRPSQINIEENISIVKIGEPIVVTKNHHETNKKKYAFTIVTGVSKNHFCPIKGFVYNLKNTLKGLNARIVIYDLGLTDVQQEEIKNLRDNGYFDELRVFNYSAYPSFWDISKNRGEYAWKPGVVEEVSNEYPGIIVWLDSGTLPERRYFEKLPYLLKKYNGFLSPRSSGFMNTWTHPGVYDYYGDDASKYEDFPNCNGAAVAFDTKKTRHIIKSWYLCALDKDCIAPSGSNRTNHRQDQSILTYLISRERGRSCSIRKSKIWIHTHEDSNCRKIITFYEKLNNINNSY